MIDNLENNWKTNTLALLLAVFTFILISGCRNTTEQDSGSALQERDLKVGYIDSDKLLFDYPEFKSFMKKKDKESEFIRNKIESARKLNKFSEADKKYVKDLTLDFMQKEQNILKKFVEQVRTASTAVQNEKKFDLVINNSASAPVIEYGGVDITEDVQARMVELRKEGTPVEKEEKEKK